MSFFKNFTPTRIAQTKVELDFFTLMMEKMSERPPENFGDPILAAFFANVESQGIEPGPNNRTSEQMREDSLKTMAASERFFALSKLMRNGHLEKWVKPAEGEESETAVLVHPVIYEAACIAPLKFKKGRAFFHPKAFIKSIESACESNPDYAEMP